MDNHGLIRFLLVAGAMLGGTAVAAGAVGSHLLESRFVEADEETAAGRLANWETAVRYQIYHALALISLAGVSRFCEHRRINLAAVFFVVGCILFCGMLYAYALSQLRFFVFLVPVGGLSFLLGWLVLFTSFRKTGSAGNEQRNRRAPSGQG